MRSTRQLAWLVMGAVLAVGALVAAGEGALAFPPTGSWVAVQRWYEQAGPGAAALVGLRVVALVGAGWLVVACALQLLAVSSPSRTASRIADVVTPPVLLRLAHGVAGLSVTVGLAGPPAPADPSGTAVMEVLDLIEPPSTEPPATTSSTSPAESAPAAREEEVVVVTGDSFWSLAAEAVADARTPVAVDDYWRRLVATNLARLVDPGNPDLLYPGQVLALPPVEG